MSCSDAAPAGKWEAASGVHSTGAPLRATQCIAFVLTSECKRSTIINEKRTENASLSDEVATDRTNQRGAFGALQAGHQGRPGDPRQRRLQGAEEGRRLPRPPPGVGYRGLKTGGFFLAPGLANFVVIKKPATKARKGINPFTKEPMTFKAKPAGKVIKARPVKAVKDAVA